MSEGLKRWWSNLSQGSRVGVVLLGLVLAGTIFQVTPWANDRNRPAEVSEPEQKESSPAENKPASWPWQFIDRKQESFGHRNVMDLYAFPGRLDHDRLIEFCRERKKDSPAKAFYYVVIFDDASSAAFPGNPFTARYSGYPDVLSHIRAVFWYNKLNDSASLEYHPENISEHTPVRVTDF